MIYRMYLTSNDRETMDDIQALEKKFCCAMSVLSSWKSCSAGSRKNKKTVTSTVFGKAGRWLALTDALVMKSSLSGKYVWKKECGEQSNSPVPGDRAVMGGKRQT